MTAVAVGRLLSISSRTVNKHAENVYAKLRVHNRQEAINVCRRLGMMDPSRSAPRAQAKSR
jgi:DNA-binding CsgD family transcriptional regulator